MTLNLDQLAARHAQAMVRSITDVTTLERLATKALGVLQGQGVYAMLLFLFSRSSDEREIAPDIRRELYAALKALPGFENENIQDKPDKALKFFADKVLEDLDTLLLVRDLYEQTLIYARYGAKAAEA